MLDDPAGGLRKAANFGVEVFIAGAERHLEDVDLPVRNAQQLLEGGSVSLSQSERPCKLSDVGIVELSHRNHLHRADHQLFVISSARR